MTLRSVGMGVHVFTLCAAVSSGLGRPARWTNSQGLVDAHALPTQAKRHQTRGSSFGRSRGGAGTWAVRVPPAARGGVGECRMWGVCAACIYSGRGGRA